MNGMIDLHMHSTISDGTDTPEQILFNVKKAGIQLFSVTDHDALAGSLIIPGLLKEDDPVFIPGVEISCRDGKTKKESVCRREERTCHTR